LSAAGGPLVLVADDDADILELVRLRFERAGFAVVTASDGEAAWQLALDRVPALAVLDLSMPRLDGLALTQRLREDPRTAACKVLVLTAAAQPADAERATAAGADDYVPKPFAARELVARAQALVGGR
jgi:DNA-binding response OmpR family regulator